ncbi:MAG TPA: tetratricopeptide repeat protein [Chthoniobacterales bacterium]|nr:tetratricopeptide repeat protein [Chthoniobacterales bacterium]
MTTRTIPLWKIVAVAIGLVTLTWIVFGQTLSHQFVNFDDGAYVYRNFDIRQGITLQQVGRAFTQPVAGNWHPLTMLSHMLDCRIYGVQPWGHHLTNTILHTLSVLVLFLTLQAMTGAVWRSAAVAGIFAVHPLHVESVAWIAERKDVLSGLFFMLTLAAYVAYSRRPGIGKYFLVAVLFAFGLMSKPMLVTLPFVLLLVDYWPLRRYRDATASIGGRRLSGWLLLILEKIPFVVLSAATSVVALLTQHPDRNAVNLPLSSRIANACVSIGIYLRQTFVPRDLACFYPHPLQTLSGSAIALSIALIIAISGSAWILRRRCPYLIAGWFWFVGMLVPVLGIIQVGNQAYADRYTYLPQIGLGLAMSWGIADLLGAIRYRDLIFTAISVTALVAFTWVARIQTSYWRSSEALWEHATAVTPENENAEEHLSDAYLEKGRIDDAVAAARRAVDARAGSADAQGVLGAALARKGRLDEALAYLEKALQLNPKLARVHFNLANILMERGQMADAVSNYETELQLYPNFPEGHNNLANALLRTGKIDEALGHLRIALKLNPNYPEAHNNLAIVLSQKGQMREAIGEWKRTLLIDSNNLEAQCNLAWVFATFPDSAVRNGTQAVESAEKAIQLSGGKNARIWRLAAAAYAEAGRFPEAIKAAQNGLALAEAEGNSALAQTLQANIKLFEEGSPLRD